MFVDWLVVNVHTLAPEECKDAKYTALVCTPWVTKKENQGGTIRRSRQPYATSSSCATFLSFSALMCILTLRFFAISIHLQQSNEASCVWLTYLTGLGANVVKGNYTPFPLSGTDALRDVKTELV